MGNCIRAKNKKPKTATLKNIVTFQQLEQLEQFSERFRTIFSLENMESLPKTHSNSCGYLKKHVRVCQR